jgi:hypothetical protein
MPKSRRTLPRDPTTLRPAAGQVLPRRASPSQASPVLRLISARPSPVRRPTYHMTFPVRPSLDTHRVVKPGHRHNREEQEQEEQDQDQEWVGAPRTPRPAQSTPMPTPTPTPGAKLSCSDEAACRTSETEIAREMPVPEEEGVWRCHPYPHRQPSWAARLRGRCRTSSIRLCNPHVRVEAVVVVPMQDRVVSETGR